MKIYEDALQSIVEILCIVFTKAPMWCLAFLSTAVSRIRHLKLFRDVFRNTSADGKTGEQQTLEVFVMFVLRNHTFAGIATLLCPRRADRSVPTVAEHFNIVAHAIMDAEI